MILFDISILYRLSWYHGQERMNFVNFMKIYFMSLCYSIQFLKIYVCGAMGSECEIQMMAQCLLYIDLRLFLWIASHFKQEFWSSFIVEFLLNSHGGQLSWTIAHFIKESIISSYIDSHPNHYLNLSTKFQLKKILLNFILNYFFFKIHFVFHFYFF